MEYFDKQSKYRKDAQEKMTTMLKDCINRNSSLRDEHAYFAPIRQLAEKYPEFRWR